MPSISVDYGLSDIEHKNITDPFSDINLIDIKLRHTSRKSSQYSENFLKYGYDYLFLDYISSDLAGSSGNSGELDSKTLRFGFGDSKGYGYKMGDSAVIPYYPTSFEWSTIDFPNPATNDADQHLLNRFSDGLVRLSVRIEKAEDIIEDLEQALNKVKEMNLHQVELQ